MTSAARITSSNRMLLQVQQVIHVSGVQTGMSQPAIDTRCDLDRDKMAEPRTEVPEDTSWKVMSGVTAKSRRRLPASIV
jgi:hypothetical protein